MNGTRAARFASFAARYAELGWALTPLAGKKGLSGWNTAAAQSPEHVERVWRALGAWRNLGLVAGNCRPPLAILDVDRDDADAAALELLGATELPSTPIVRTGKGRLQVYFADPGGVRKAAKDGFELRVGAHICVLPPSVHPETKREYAWEAGCVPWLVEPQPLPTRLIEFFGADTRRRRAPIPQKLTPGSRYPEMLRLAGAMRRVGAERDEILAALRVMNENRCDPPKDDEDLTELVDDVVARYLPGGGSDG